MLLELQSLIALSPVVWLVCVFALGVIIGSFLNVYIYRFHTGRSLSGHSHCLTCQTPLRFYDLFPLVSYLSIRGRCRYCGAYIPPRYFWVELITGIGFVMAVVQLPFAIWILGAALCAMLVVVAVYDLQHMIIPNEFVWALCVVALVLVGYQFVVTPGYGVLLQAALGALLGFCFFGGLWWYSQGRWIGFGDAKLAIPFGMMTGVVGMFSVIVLSFWIGAVISVAIIFTQRLRARGQLHLRFTGQPLTIQSEVPFAPFFILGFVIVFFFGVDVLDFFMYVW